MPARRNDAKITSRAHQTSRLASPDASRLAPAVRHILDEEAERFGAPLNTTLVWTHRPALLAAYRGHADTPLERLVLGYADGMTISGADTSDALYAALRGHFSPAEMVELTVHVAFENFRSRFNHAFRVEAQGFCRLPR